MEELYKKYELKLDEIQRGIGEQLTYMYNLLMSFQMNSFQGTSLCGGRAPRVKLPRKTNG